MKTANWTQGSETTAARKRYETPMTTGFTVCIDDQNIPVVLKQERPRTDGVYTRLSS